MIEAHLSMHSFRGHPTPPPKPTTATGQIRVPALTQNPRREAPDFITSAAPPSPEFCHRRLFDVCASGQLIWSRQADGHFPDIKELKQIVRDRIAPGKDLGHSTADF